MIDNSQKGNSIKKVVITQSNYIPWKGYFDAIALADELILLDEVQYTKRDWRNRNTIKTPNGLLWLTIPVQVKGKYDQAIKDTLIADPKWAMQHWKSIEMNYAKAPYFKELGGFFEALYLKAQSTTHLSEVNLSFLRGICSLLEIKTPIRFSHELKSSSDRNERLIDICLQTGATDYFSGPAAKNYIDEQKFKEAGINLHFFDYSGYKEYPQSHGEFTHTVSVVDLLFNVGGSARSFLKN